jgi:glycosyltransferase involved in cell wall biosynthesis
VSARAVHQFAPTLEPGAVGAHMLEAQRALRDAGFESEIFVESIAPSMAGQARLLGEYGSAVPAADDATLVYQYAIGSVVADVVAGLPGTLIVNSHTQTPPEFLAGWDDGATYGVSWGMQQLARLSERAALGIACSHHNEIEMRAAGFRNTVVVPVLFRADVSSPDASLLAAYPSEHDGARWLFVGRLSPNKAQHAIIQAFVAYRTAYDPKAELFIVGGQGSPKYGAMLRHLVRDLNCDGAVHITGGVSPAQLAAYYKLADVFVCMSDHEGFCVPLVEAMSAQLPVVAFAAAAIPETLGDAGILLTTKQPSVVAAAVHRVLTDDTTRSLLTKHGLQRAESLAIDRTRTAFVDAVKLVMT